MHRQLHQLTPRRHLVTSLDPVAVLHVVLHLLALLQVQRVVVLEVWYAAEIGVLNSHIDHTCSNFSRKSKGNTGQGARTHIVLWPAAAAAEATLLLLLPPLLVVLLCI